MIKGRAEESGEPVDAATGAEWLLAEIFGRFRKEPSQQPRDPAQVTALQEAIDQMLKTLTWREREVLKLRYGFGDGTTYTLGEVGRIFRTTKERVRQIEARALRKMQHPARASHLENF